MIVTRSGFLGAVRYVSDYLDGFELGASVVLGWKKRPQQINQGDGRANRVVFTPSDEGGGAGRIVPVRQPGARDIQPAADQPRVATIRSLADWDRLALVSVWAVDRDAPEDEDAQIEATEALFEWVVRAVHSAPGAFANAIWSDLKWTVPVERAFGRELLAKLTFRHPIFDVPREVAYPSAAVQRANE